MEETHLRRVLFEQMGASYAELITRPDIKVFLPPIGGVTAYIFGPPEYLGDETKKVVVRSHDECNGSDVFGSDICTCRPYLVQGVEEAILCAQQGGYGIVVYNRKEGRALGEVTKYLVYNARKRQEGGDRGDTYFMRTECVAGVQDARFQELLPDVLNYLGVKHIDRFISMSNDKYDNLIKGGITCGERVDLPIDRIAPESMVEIDAKVAHGYFVADEARKPSEETLHVAKGRAMNDY